MKIDVNQYLVTKYNTQRYYTEKAMLWMFATFIFLSSLLIFIALIFKAGGTFVFIGYAFLCVVPFIFIKRLKNIFTRNVFAEFNSKSFLIKEYTLKSGSLIKEFNCRWEDIKYYKVVFSNGNYTNIIFHLKDGLNKSYVFKDNKTENESLNEESIFSTFHSYISMYNTKTLNEKIFLSLPFITTKRGKICIILFSFFSVVAILSQFLLPHNFLPISLLIGVIINLKLYFNRRNYKKTYDNILNLNDGTYEINLGH